jgi:hypothetical protein
MRYYFHLRIGGVLDPDKLGIELPDLETAYLEAFQAAQEMWSELLTQRADPLSRAFEIADADGQVLLTLPFREVLDRARKPTAPPASKRRRATETLLQRHHALATSLNQEADRARALVEKTLHSLRRASACVHPLDK